MPDAPAATPLPAGPPDALALTLDEVCAALKITQSSWYKRRAALRRAGFPEPLPGFAGRWSRHAVERWISSNAYREPLPAADDERLVADQAARLNARYGAG